MAIRSGFFNSVNGDRKYNAGSFAEYFASFIGNGVFPNPSTNLQVVSNNDMTVTVKAGRAWINGYILINDDDYILAIDSADGVLNRIDRVVARYDVVDREIRLEVKQGDYATDAVVKDLQRDADAYELALADIQVNKGIISITQANITDLRLNTELCGIVHGIIDQIDITTLYNQYTEGFQLKQQEFEQEFNTWLATIQDALDGDTAGNLLSMINTNISAINTLNENKVDKVTGKGLSTEDYTTEEKIKLGGVSKQATKVETSSINGNIKIDNLQAKVYEHPGSGTNPHGTTKADVGLSLVQNYGIATQAQAEAGTANNVYVTPLNVAQAIRANNTYSAGNTYQIPILDIYSASSPYNPWLSSIRNYTNNSTGVNVYQKAIDTVINFSGSVRVKFTLKGGANGVELKARIYRNGIAVGTERVIVGYISH